MKKENNSQKSGKYYLNIKTEAKCNNNFFKKKYIYSESRDLFFLSERNFIANLCEIYGLYCVYCEECIDMSFKDFYRKKRDSKYSYRYRYFTQKKIKKILLLKGYDVSRREIKMFSKTKYMQSVRTSINMDIIFYELILQIIKEDVMKDILLSLKNNEPFVTQGFLKFQYVSVTKFLGNRNNNQNIKKLFREVRANWDNIINYINTL